MKNLKIVITALLLFVALAGIGQASIPPPPVEQNISFYDAGTNAADASLCRGCHTGTGSPPNDVSPMDRHHNLLPTPGFPYGCNDCHPTVGTPGSQTMYVEKNCINCHNGTGFYLVPFVNPGRPHHDTAQAQARNCKYCHGGSVVDNYNDGHYVPPYNTSTVTPYADNKVYNATGYNPNNPLNVGRYWGGCISCHQNKTTATPVILSNRDTHHGAINDAGTTGYKCSWCHVTISGAQSDSALQRIIALSGQGGPLNGPNASAGYPYGRLLPMRNSTIIASDIALGYLEPPTTNITINGTGCQKCHSVQTLHNIQYNYAGTTGVNAKAGYGHIGMNADCNGCHAFWNAGADNAFPGPVSIDLYSINPSKITAGVDTVVTFTGMNLVQSGYSTNVVINGVSYTPTSVTDTQAVATINLPAGAYQVQLDKGGLTSKLSTLMVGTPVTISSAKLESGTITIEGTGFGTPQAIVTITKADGSIIKSDGITSWDNVKIVATSAAAAVDNTVTVTTPTNSATATITGGTVTDSVTVTYPNAAGITWKRGTAKTVTWDKAGSSQALNVKIELVQGTKKTTLKSSTSNDGSQSVTISSKQATGDYKIRITALGHTPAYSDESDNTFSVTR